MATVAACGRARTTRGSRSKRGRRPFTALGNTGARGKYSFSAPVTARAGGFLIGPALLAKQFELKVAVRTKIFVDRHV